MEIYLLDINKEMTDAWQQEFTGIENIHIVNDDFSHFMDQHPEIEAVVSPANSFGLMDGGYDKAITDYFGKRLKRDVQQKIMYYWFGEQPVGTSMTVPIHERILSYGGAFKKNGDIDSHTNNANT